MAGRRRRKFLWVLLSVVLLLVLVIAAVPLWFPWVLPTIAKRFGASYAHYQRVGYERFKVSGFELTNSSGQIHAGEATAFVPTVWLWKHFTTATGEPFLIVDSWKYELNTNKPSRSNAPFSVRTEFDNLNRLSATLRNWMPTAALTNGTILIPRWPLQIPQAVWENAKLTARISFSNEQPFVVTAAVEQTNQWKLNADSETQEFHSTTTIVDRDGKLDVTGTAEWMTNHIELAAEFPGHGFIPDTASLRADSFDVPAHLLGLKQYEDVSGAFRADCQTNHFVTHLTARAVPESTNLPPLEIELGASGDTNAAHLDIAKISSPALQGGLAAPVTISFHAPYLAEPATLDVIADLGQQHQFVAKGKLSGKATVYPAEKLPRVSFTLSGQGAGVSSITTSNLEMTGELNWPLLDLKNAHVEMNDGSQVNLGGIFDLKQRTVRDGRFHSSGPFGRQFLPAGYSFSSATADGQFAGGLDSLTNSATVEVKQLSAPHLKSMDAEVQWNGNGLNFTAAQARITAGNSEVVLRGSAAIGPGEKSVTLTALDMSESNHTAMRLQQPVRMTFDIKRADTNAPWSLDLEPLVMAGDGREFRLAARVNWPERGEFNCQAQGLDARLLADFIPQANTEAMLNQLNLSGGWTNGPIDFQLASQATLKTREQVPFSATTKLTGGKSGISIEQLSVSTTNQAVCRAEGSLPISCDPTARDGMIQIDSTAPLKLGLMTDPNSILWEKIAEATGLRLQEPKLAANLEGTWAAPKGQVTLQAQKIELSHSKYPLPTVENLDFIAVMDRATAHVSRFNFQVEKQPVNITAQIPLGESFWAGLRHRRRLPDWRTATAHLTMENAQLAAFTPLLPQILSAEGTASADISLQPGGNFQGEFSVKGARTHPLESIGPVRNIQVLARLQGSQVQLADASAEIGGQRVNLDGAVEINEQLLKHNGLPPFHVHLSGTNVPLARNPSILLRADLNLAVTNAGLQVPLVSGAVRLRDSLYLADLQTLVPERTASPRRRPPYFSIEAEPWAHWHLNVNVTGDRFLRVQAPVFQGTVSTVLTLGGTLKEPVALGVVKIDSGSTINFPFSNLDVKQGLISLTSENPYDPSLFVTAESRRFGYDVKMEVRGPVDQPIIQFSSIPGLSSAEITLMLTAGQVPQGVGVTSSTQQRAEGLGLFVGKNVLSDFGLGGGGQQRLTIRSGQEISESGRPTYEVEYKFTDRWSVIGEYDRFDQYNLNVKVKVYSK